MASAGGDVRVSRATAMLVSQGQGAVGEGSGQEARPFNTSKEADLVQHAFTVLTRKDRRVKQQSTPLVSQLWILHCIKRYLPE